MALSDQDQARTQRWMDLVGPMPAVTAGGLAAGGSRNPPVYAFEHASDNVVRECLDGARKALDDAPAAVAAQGKKAAAAVQRCLDIQWSAADKWSAVLRRDLPSQIDAMAASQMWRGVTKSGSPTPSEMTFSICCAISKKRRIPEGGQFVITVFSGLRGVEKA